MDLILQQGFLIGFLEILGAAALKEVLPQQGAILHLDPIDLKEPLPARFFDDLDACMTSQYGATAEMGIAHTAGRLAFRSYKDGIPVLEECGKVEQRLLPFSEKITNALQVFMHVLHDQDVSDMMVQYDRIHNTWSMEGSILPGYGSFIRFGRQHFFMGVMESLLEWMDSRHAFQIAQEPSTQSKKDALVFAISVVSFD